MSQVYAGALPMLAILVFGVARGLAWTREIRFFSLALIVLIVYGLGRYTPAFRVLFDFLPGVSAFRRPGRRDVPDRRPRARSSAATWCIALPPAARRSRAHTGRSRLA